MLDISSKFFYILSLLLMLANQVDAADVVKNNKHLTNTFFSVQYENDLFSPNNKDRYYTSGIQLTTLKQEATPIWLENIAKHIPFYQKGNGINLVQYTLAQKMFTPDDIQAPILQVNDRPYAGYLYFSAAVISQLNHSKNIDSGNLFEITMGIVGPSALAEQVQTFAHQVTKSPIPKGWNNQLKDEFALGLNFSKFSRIVKPISKALYFGVSPQFSGTIGNVYTYGSIGVMFRVGNNLRHDLSPPTIRPGFLGTSYFQKSRTHSWYIYLGFEERLVLRNIFLDGNTFVKSHRVEKKQFISDIQYGITYIFDDLRISLSSMIRSKEFTSQQSVTNYGAINFTFRY